MADRRESDGTRPLFGADQLSATGLELSHAPGEKSGGKKSGPRLALARFEIDEISGDAGEFRYQVGELSLDQVTTVLGRTQLNADAGDLTGLQLDSEHVNISVQRVSCPNGLSYSGNHELYAPHASLEDVRIAIDDPLELVRAREKRPPDEPLDLHFLDALQGQLDIDLAVDMTLPWVGRRRVTHYFRIPIEDGTIDFERLEDDVHWLEAAFLTIDVVGDRLVLARDLPLLPVAGKALLWWPLEPEDLSMAAFRRVHLRNLLRWRVPDPKKRAAALRARRGSAAEKPAPADDPAASKSQDASSAGAERREKGKTGRSKLTLHALAMQNVKLALHATRPAQVSLSPLASLQFGDDQSPGLSDLALEGEIRYRRDSADAPARTSLRGSADLIDVTLKDVSLGTSALSVDRLHIGEIEHFELFFSGFSLRRVELVIGRMAATNLRLQLPEES